MGKGGRQEKKRRFTESPPASQLEREIEVSQERSSEASSGIEMVLEQPRRILEAAAANDKISQARVEAARQQILSLKNGLEEDRTLYPRVTDGMIEEMESLVARADHILANMKDKKGGKSKERLVGLGALASIRDTLPKDHEEKSGEQFVEPVLSTKEASFVNTDHAVGRGSTEGFWQAEQVEKESKKLVEEMSRMSRMLDFEVGRLSVSHPGPGERGELIDNLVNRKITEDQFLRSLGSWEWQAADSQSEEQKRVFLAGAQELARIMQRWSELHAQSDVKAEPASYVSQEQEKNKAPAMLQEHDKEQRKREVQEVSRVREESALGPELEHLENEMSRVGDRLIEIYNRLAQKNSWHHKKANFAEVARLLERVARGEDIDNAQLLSHFKPEFADGVQEMVDELPKVHAEYLALEAKQGVLRDGEKKDVQMIEVGEGEDISTETGSSLEAGIDKKAFEAVRREMNKKIGKSFAAKDRQRRVMQEGLRAELDNKGDLVSTVGQRGLLGKRKRPEQIVVDTEAPVVLPTIVESEEQEGEDKNWGEVVGGATTQSFSRGLGRELASESEASRSEYAFTEALDELKHACDLVRQRILSFREVPEIEDLNDAVKAVEATEKRAAKIFEILDTQRPGYKVLVERAKAVMRDRERVRQLLEDFRSEQYAKDAQEVAQRSRAEKTEYIPAQAEQVRRSVQFSAESLSAAQDNFLRQVRMITRRYHEGKLWKIDDLNDAIQDVREQEAALQRALEKMEGVYVPEADELLEQVERVSQRANELRERRKELIRLLDSEPVAQEPTDPRFEVPNNPDEQHETHAVQFERVEPRSWVARKTQSIGRGLRYLMNGWSGVKNAAYDTTYLMGSQVTGELTPSERGEVELGKVSEGMRIAAGFLSTALLTGTGTAFFADLPRYLSQKMFTAAERKRLKESLMDTLSEGELHERTLNEDSRTRELRRSIEVSRYLTQQQKEEMLNKIVDLDRRYIAWMEDADLEAQKEIAKLVDDAVKTRVRGTRVAKEALNTALTFTGLAILRPGAYGVISLLERYRNVAEAGPEKSFEAKMRAAFVSGFSEWHQKLMGEVGDTQTARVMNRLSALSTLARGLGVVGGAMTETVMITTLLAAAGAPPLFSESGIEQPEPIISVAQRPELFAPEGVPEAESDEGVFRGEIPKDSDVRKFDGVVAALARVIKNNPEAYGYSGSDSDIGQELFAKKLAMQIADREGIVRNDWLSDKSIGQLHIVPERDGEQWKIAFVDKSGHKLDVDDVREQGYLVKADWKQRVA